MARTGQWLDKLLYIHKMVKNEANLFVMTWKDTHDITKSTEA